MKHNSFEDGAMGQAASYALGALSQDEAREFELHLVEGCGLCDLELKAFASVVERLGLGALQEEPPPQLRAKLFAELAEEIDSDNLRQVISRGAITIRLNEGEWVEWWKGVYVKRLYTDRAKGMVTDLYRMLPGARLPSHLHLGVEQCIILEGDYHLNNEVLGPGDYHCALPGSIDDDLYTVGGTLFLVVAPQRCELLK